MLEVDVDSFYLKRCDLLRYLWSSPSYTELSPSNTTGNLEHGFHIICKGIPTIGGAKLRDVKVEFYGWSCFLTFTGNVVAGRHVITDELAREGGVMCSPEWADKFRRDASAEVFDANRQQDLTDDEVIQLASKYNRVFREMYGKAFAFGEVGWSRTCYTLVAELDRQSGLIDQIKRIMLASVFVRKSDPKNGKTRTQKFNRIFPGIMQRVRPQNDADRYHAAFGEKVAQALLASWAEKRRLHEEKIREGRR